MNPLSRAVEFWRWAFPCESWKLRALEPTSRPAWPHPFTFRSLDPALVDEGVTAPSRGFLLNNPENRPFFFF